MGKEFDYKNLYLTVYKKIPNIIFISTFVFVAITAFILGLCVNSVIGILIIFVGIFVAWLIAHIVRFIIAVSISQTIVMTDAILSIQDEKCTTQSEQNTTDSQKSNGIEETTVTRDSIGLWFIGKCEMCGLDSTKVTYAPLSDEMGIRYRNTCKSCFEKYNFKIEKK